MHNRNRDDLANPAAALAAERIEALDALRGFALFGILLANILYWSGWGLMLDTQRLALAGAEGVRGQYVFHNLLIDGKFYTLFSLLFGAGFALQLDRLERRGSDGLRIYRRRVLVLLAIGLIHSWLIWDGDILTVYALLGLVLPLFVRWRDRSLVISAGTLIFAVPLAGKALFAALGWMPEASFYDLSDRIARSMGTVITAENGVSVLASGDISDLAAWVISGTPFSWGLRLESWRIPKLLGIMLFGLVVGRRLAAGTLLGDRTLLWRVLAVGLAIGVPASAVYAWRPGQNQADWPSVVGTVPLALAYAAAFLLAWPKAKPMLGWFAPPGRMALTNYLSHTVIGVVLFYGIGFGVIGKLPPLAIYAVAVTVFAAQVLLSRWWLARHAMGPMERLWRNLTYGSRSE